MPEKQVIGISHGDCIEDAEFLRSLVLKKFKVKEIIMNPVGPVIGSHVGPGMVSLCFFVNSR
jgi:fatty acid-binding protein DegV